MSHAEQLGFFRIVAASNESVLTSGRLLEIGSYDVNGSVRSVFKDVADYVGVDLAPGPGVDRIGFGHEIDEPEGSFDAVISGECFEHDPHWRETFTNMVRLTRPGGLVAFTCASRGRPEHGTTRTRISDSPGTQEAGIDYYSNLARADFVDAFDLGQWFSQFAFWTMPTTFDLYFAGVRVGIPANNLVANLPRPREVNELRRLLPLPQRLVRLPLRILASTRLPESRYQDLIRPYWQGLLRLQARLS